MTVRSGPRIGLPTRRSPVQPSRPGRQPRREPQGAIGAIDRVVPQLSVEDALEQFGTGTR